ncbi:uncharacterized protein EAF02_010019 [Botrytis sinoallii]|uniref:uncharacterized protein n=1 Tax=Botrytis sinoallii TaxID=1463999 RepID=UPI0019023AC5|nr:uncharacterized protein EAF02_010019 [Botrytis sinoallii]KAF7865596.1 hypothetical protein EAF02_010019 [Botrytis sinoallii]
MNSQDQSSDQAPAQDQSSNDQAPAQSSDSQTPVDFTLFPQIPLDIRVMIWKATLTPRVFSRRCLSPNSNQSLYSVNISSLLSVNAETRYEALKCKSPLLIDPDFVKKVQVSPEVFMNSSWTWNQMLRNWQDNYHRFEDIGLGWYEMNRHRIMFTYLRFNNLNEFILQDVDCALPHKLDSPDTRATCKRFLSTMFQAEITRESKAHIQVSIPIIIVLPGAK